MKRIAFAALLVPLVACASSEPWTFALSRSVYERPIDPDAPLTPTPTSAEVAAIVLVLPLAVDLVFFPIALTRDLIVMD